MDGCTDRQMMDEWMDGRKEGRMDGNQIQWKAWARQHIRLLSSLDSLFPSITRIQDLIQKHLFSPFLKSPCFARHFHYPQRQVHEQKVEPTVQFIVIQIDSSLNTGLSKPHKQRRMTGRTIY